MTCLLKQDTLTSPFSQVTNQHESQNYDNVKGTLLLSKSVPTKKTSVSSYVFKGSKPKKMLQWKLYTCKKVMFKIKPWFPEQCNFLGKHILTVKSEWKFCGWSSRKKVVKILSSSAFYFPSGRWLRDSSYAWNPPKNSGQEAGTPVRGLEKRQ